MGIYHFSNSKHFLLYADLYLMEKERNHGGRIKIWSIYRVVDVDSHDDENVCQHGFDSFFIDNPMVDLRFYPVCTLWNAAGVSL